MLVKCHPRVAYRDCDKCRKWWYDEKTGKVHQKNGKDCLRPAGTLPCEDKKQGCPKGHYKNQKSLNQRNAMTYQYIKEGEAVNWLGVAVDSVVRRNAAIIRDIEQSAEKAEQYRLMSHTSGLAGLMGGANVNG